MTNEVVGTFKGPGTTGAKHLIQFTRDVIAEYLTFQLRKKNAILQIQEIKLNEAQSLGKLNGGGNKGVPGIPGIPGLDIFPGENFRDFGNRALFRKETGIRDYHLNREVGNALFSLWERWELTIFFWESRIGHPPYPPPLE